MALQKNSKVDLKLKYRKTFEVSIVIALLLIIFVFKFSPKVEGKQLVIKAPQDLVEITCVLEITKPDTVPPPPKPIIPIEVPADAELEDTTIESTELDPKEIITSPPPRTDEEEKEVVHGIYCFTIAKTPQPIGGIEAIQKQIIYPEVAKRAKVQGTVYVEAFIDTNGVVKKTRIIKGIGAGCDEAAIAAIMKTKFKPGEQRRKPVKTQVTIPLLFKLD